MGLSIPIDQAHYAGLTIGMLLYGIYLPLFFLVMYILYVRDTKSRVVTGAQIMLFLLVTSYYILASYDIWLSFIPNRVDPGTIVQLNSYTDRLPPAKDLIYMAMVAIADAMLIWRLVCIWPDNKPLLGLVAVLYAALWITGVIICKYEAHQTDENHRTLQLWATGSSAVIVATNTVVTAAITWRLRWMGKQISVFGTDSAKTYHSIIFVMVQNGFLYLLALIMQVLIYGMGVDGGVYLFIHINPSIVAIFPSLILLQLHLPHMTKVRTETTLTPWPGGRKDNPNIQIQVDIQAIADTTLESSGVRSSIMAATPVSAVASSGIHSHLV